MRGEYPQAALRAIRTVGSSPHAWGIRCSLVASIFKPRFIPTCVGNTARARPGWRSGSVHPHMRGEYGSGFGRRSSDFGSSPHAWGILHQVLPDELLLRFIPTCVGNTFCRRLQAAHWKVHPHMRGEYSSLEPSSFVVAGSSPHAWGIRMPRRFAMCATPVHPHMRGEYGMSVAILLMSLGSSPHAWGIRKCLL